LSINPHDLMDLDTIRYTTEHERELTGSALQNHFAAQSGFHDTSYFHLPPGREHYRLLMHISTLYNEETLFDIGTNRCMSAMALSHNPSNKIKSYDIVQVLGENPKIPNVEFLLGDSTEDEDIKSTRFIFLDVDHDGLYEDKFYAFLKRIEWKGILVLDDIHLNEPMMGFWNGIEEEKYDLTQIGHWSGTGLVVFR
jgi:predicted O-methyltransferase YrrM